MKQKTRQSPSQQADIIYWNSEGPHASCDVGLLWQAYIRELRVGSVPFAVFLRTYMGGAF